MIDLKSASHFLDIKRKNKKQRIIKMEHSEKLMTVCIAAIAEASTSSPKVIFASDRLVTAGVCFESGVPKIKKFTDYAYVMMSSSDALISDYIVSKTQSTLYNSTKSGEDFTVEQIVELLSNECKKRVRSEKERYVLKDRHDLTYEEYKNGSKNLHERVIHDIIAETDNFEYPFIAQFLVVGIDLQPHIYVVDQWGDFKMHDLTGFATIGDGGYLAYPEITKFSYSPDVSLSEALVRVYNSKKVVERVSGVGKATDLAALYITEDLKTKQKVVALWEAPKELKDLLDSEMEEMRNQEIAAYDKVMKKLNAMFTPKETT